MNHRARLCLWQVCVCFRRKRAKKPSQIIYRRGGEDLREVLLWLKLFAYFFWDTSLIGSLEKTLQWRPSGLCERNHDSKSLSLKKYYPWHGGAVWEHNSDSVSLRRSPRPPLEFPLIATSPFPVSTLASPLPKSYKTSPLPGSIFSLASVLPFFSCLASCLLHF